MKTLCRKLAILLFVVCALGCNLFNQAAQVTDSPVQVTAAQQDTPTLEPQMATYTNTKYGYSFKYPTGLSLTEMHDTDFVTLDKQIEIYVTNLSPSQTQGDGPVGLSAEHFDLHGAPAIHSKGYIGSIGGNTPQSYESIIVTHNGLYYHFTVYELKRDVVLPDDRQQFAPVPLAALQLFEQVISTIDFVN
jgi:hypothetical protein